MKLKKIIDKIRRYEFEVSLHACEQAVEDFLSLNDVISALSHAELIEHYPDRCRCLLYCKVKRQHVHLVIDYYDFKHDLSSNIEIITIYKPDPKQWLNYRKRIH
jgi:hypothetical protein